MADGKNSTLAGPGHNSMDRTKLKNLVERFDNVLDQRDELDEALKDLIEEVKGADFSVKAFKTAVKIRRMEKEKQQKLAEDREQADLYLSALGNGDIFG